MWWIVFNMKNKPWLAMLIWHKISLANNTFKKLKVCFLLKSFSYGKQLGKAARKSLRFEIF